jgi:HEAT repeat protein
MAAFLLGERKDPRAVEPLIQALNDNSSSVRRSAAHALGELKDPRIAELFIQALNLSNYD